MSGMKQRITQEGYAQRLDQLLQIKAMGYTDSQLVKSCQQFWNLSERQAYRYLKAVRDLEAAMGDDPMAAHRGRLLNRARHLYATAIQEKDLSHALKATELELKLLESLKDLTKEEQEYAGTTSASSNRLSRELLEALGKPGKGRKSTTKPNPH